MTLKVLATASGLYIFPKVLHVLTDGVHRPDGRAQSVFRKFRRIIALISESVADHMGEFRWNFMAGSVENSWISYLFVSLIFRKEETLDFKGKICMASLVVGLSSIAWISRSLLSKSLSLANRRVSLWIEPRSLRCVSQFHNLASQPSEIPERFHSDVFLSRRICPITLEPTLDHVTDPTSNGRVTYSRRFIEAWVRRYGTSPLTRQPLDISQLQRRVVWNWLSSRRLRMLQERERASANAEET